MMWFFAVLVVLALGGVAAVASGRGAPMSVEYDDRRDVAVPADRLLVEDDVRRVRFSTALLGYRQSEVDALLERLARELTERDAAPAPGETPALTPEPGPALVTSRWWPRRAGEGVDEGESGTAPAAGSDEG